MDFVAQVVLTSIFWVPGVVILYWVIRLAVRHALEDAHKDQATARRWAAVVEAERRKDAAHGGSEPE